MASAGLLWQDAPLLEVGMEPEVPSTAPLHAPSWLHYWPGWGQGNGQSRS